MKKLLLFILLSPTVFFSQESDFKFAVDSKDLKVYIKEEGNYTAWIKFQNEKKKLKNAKTGRYYYKGGGYELQYWDCTCSSKQFDVGEIVKYSDKGTVLEINDIGMQNQRVIPGSIGEKIFNIICGWDDYEQDIFMKNFELNSIRVQNYYNGFEKGYIASYCYPAVECEVEIPEIGKFTLEKLKDDEKDFEIGYNDGYSLADKKKTKK